MGEKQGTAEPVDYKDVESGPLDENNRQCRDVFCCLLYFLCVCAMIYCTIHAYTQGDPSRIFRGIASGFVCGQSPAQDYPYLYFYNPINSIDNRVCVKECPIASNTTVTPVQCFNPIPGTFPDNCTFNVTINSEGNFNNGSVLNTTNNKTFIGYPSTDVMNRVCLPSIAVLTNAFNQAMTTISNSIQTGQFATIVQDVQNNWQWLLAGVAFAIVISLIFMFLLRCLVGIIVWFSILGSILAFIGLGIVFLYNGGKIQSSNLGFLGIPTFSGSQYYNVYGYICFGIAGVLIILLICCCNRIRLAVAVCKVAGQFVIRVCQVTFVPIILAALLIGMWAACLVCMVYLLSATNFVIFPGDIFTSVQSYTESSLFRLYFFIFGTLWTNALIQAIGIFTIASACCMWYYNHGANSQLDSPVTRSAKMAFRYHFGSLAFGSFLLAVVQFVELIVDLFKKHAENTGVAQQNQCFQCAIKCLQCCLACLKRIIQFINETAYIQIALRGKNFCMAAKDGFQTVLNNGIRYMVVAGIGKLMMFIGRILIAVGTTLAFYCLITFVPSIKENILQPLYLLLIIFIISFAVGALFIYVYSMAIDTILACFIVDEMNQKARGGKALYGPSELNDLLPDS